MTGELSHRSQSVRYLCSYDFPFDGKILMELLEDLIGKVYRYCYFLERFVHDKDIWRVRMNIDASRSWVRTERQCSCHNCAQIPMSRLDYRCG